MALKIEKDEKKLNKSRLFLEKLESDMEYKSLYNGDLISFDWLDEIEFACPYIDIIVRNPKLTLIQEENLVKVERSKRITVASVKDLAKHTQYIDDVDPKTNDVRPSKILDIRNEETFNIYENRFLYTLINDLERFVASKEKLLNNFDLIVLAGYMRILPEDVLNLGKFINIHPSLLPAFKGKDAIHRAFDAGVKVSGVTIHHVTSDLDGGKIIAQYPVLIGNLTHFDEFEAEIHNLEHKLYPIVIEKLLKDEVFDFSDLLGGCSGNCSGCH